MAVCTARYCRPRNSPRRSGVLLTQVNHEAVGAARHGERVVATAASLGLRHRLRAPWRIVACCHAPHGGLRLVQQRARGGGKRGVVDTRLRRLRVRRGKRARLSPRGLLARQPLGHAGGRRVHRQRLCRRRGRVVDGAGQRLRRPLRRRGVRLAPGGAGDALIAPAVDGTPHRERSGHAGPRPSRQRVQLACQCRAHHRVSRRNSFAMCDEMRLRSP